MDLMSLCFYVCLISYLQEERKHTVLDFNIGIILVYENINRKMENVYRLLMI